MAAHDGNTFEVLRTTNPLGVETCFITIPALERHVLIRVEEGFAEQRILECLESLRRVINLRSKLLEQYPCSEWLDHETGFSS